MNIKHKKITIAILLVLIFCAYTLYYYGSLNFVNINTHLIVCINIILNKLSKLLDFIISNEILIKTIIIFIGLIFILNKTKLLDILNIFENFKLELPNLNVSMSKLQEKADNTNIQLLESDESERNDLEVKKDLIEALIDNIFLVKILKLVLDGRKNIKIPLRCIPYEVKLEELNKIFIYNRTPNGVNIISLKPKFQEIAQETYSELLRDGIIQI